MSAELTRQSLPPVRGRPRSTSISNGSPGPPPGPSPLLTLIDSHAHLTHQWTSPHRGHGMYGGEIVSPLPIAPGGAGRMGRHRRNLSISPTGEEGDHKRSVSDGGSSPHGMHDDSMKGSHGERHGGTPAMRIPTKHHAVRSSSSTSSGSSPQSPQSPSFMNSNTGSPLSHGLEYHPLTAFPSSHAALLSGIRSHALPHPVLMDSDGSCDRNNTRSPTLSTLPQSPPFGPTSNSQHFPSPLALEVPRPVSPNFDGLPHSWDIEVAMGLEPSGEGRALPGAFESVLSPPLQPQPSEVAGSSDGSLSVNGSGSGLGSDGVTAIGRARSRSFGHASPPSLAVQFMEREEISIFGQCDMRSSVTASHPTSPPRSPPPSSPPPPCLSTSSPPSLPATLSSTLAPVVTRNRSRSFTTERNFAPNPPPLHSLPPLIPLYSTPLHSTLSPPPAPVTIDPVPIPLFELDLSRHPIDISTVDSEPSSLEPPPSPHGGTIALPPPLVAPAPLPPHLGGPPLHTAPPRRRSKSARARTTSAALASKLNALVGTEHVPKKHSPLASPSVSSNENSESEGSDEEDEEEAGATEVEMEGVGEVDRPLSPCGPPEHQEIASYLSLLTQNDLPLPKFIEEDDSSPTFDAAVAHGSERDREESERRLVDGADIVTEEEPLALVDASSHGDGFGALGFMDVDTPMSSSLETSVAPFEEAEVEEDGQAIAIDEESLSALERIFICAKSEVAEERARVAHHLAEWLCMVDICEAVEYVLPLLAGLATDSEEIVKEVFAPQLDSIMWHFFSRCPLLELEHSVDGQEAIEALSPSGSPVPSRYSTLALVQTSSTSPTSTNFPCDDSAGTLPSTSKTSPSNTEVSDVPRISSTTFTSLLGALLTDQSSVVAKSTQASLVRFLCLLKGKPIPGDSSRSPSPFNEFDPTPISFHRTEFTSLVHPSPYHLNLEARRLLEDEFLTGIVLGLARLDEDDREGEKGTEGSDVGFQSMSTRRASSSGQSDDPGQPLSLFLSPEEETLDSDDGWLSSATDTSAPPVTEGWDGEPLVSFFDDALDRTTDSTQFSMEGVPNLATSPQSPPDPMVYSNFSPDIRGDEESSLGKLVSMSLIAAIATADCLEPEVLMQQILPEVDRMKSEPMFYVRKEAMHALGCLARTLPLEVFEVSVLPLHATFARDSLWHVRRAACLALPSICKRLSPELLRTEVITNIKTFSADPSRNVRSGALEVCGELIYLFHGDAQGVPQELLAFFLGQVAPPAADPYDSVFAPLQSALDSPSETFYGSPPSWAPNTSLFAASKDPDRPVMCAFNFPAVALTLGSESWHLLQQYYSALGNSKGDKVRQSLASSLHEIAKIIGPKQADDCLLTPLSWYLRDLDHIQGAVLENIATTLRAFTPEGAKEALTMIRTEWDGIKTWRRREAVAKELGELGAYLIGTGAVEEVLGALARGFKDKVASVREAAVASLPAIFAATDLYPAARNNLLAFLAVFSEDSGYRHRVTYTAAALAAVRGGISRDTFEAYFVNTLSRLSRDGVANVRIGVARAINHACLADALYGDASSRAPIQDILQNLSHAHDRDVNDLIRDFYRSDSPPTAPIPLTGGGSRPRGQSLGGMFDDDAPLPRANRTQRYGIVDDDEYEQAHNRMDDIPLSRFPTNDSSMAGDLPIEIDYAMDDEDIEMVDEGVTVVESEPSPRLWTRELEGEEDSFVEVSRI